MHILVLVLAVSWEEHYFTLPLVVVQKRYFTLGNKKGESEQYC